MLIQEALYRPTHSQLEAWNWMVKLIFAIFFAILRNEISLFGYPDEGVSSKLIEDIKMNLLKDNMAYDVLKFFLKYTNEIKDCQNDASKTLSITWAKHQRTVLKFSSLFYIKSKC